MDNLAELEDKMSKVQAGNPEIDFKIHLGANVFAAVMSPYHILIFATASVGYAHWENSIS